MRRIHIIGIFLLAMLLASVGTVAAAGFFGKFFLGKSDSPTGHVTSSDSCGGLDLAVTPNRYVGSSISSVDGGNAICQRHFGPGWEWTEFHDESGWSMAGELVHGSAEQFAWIWIDDQPGECFSTGNRHGLTFYIQQKGDSCVNANCYPYEQLQNYSGYNLHVHYTGDIKCNPYSGDTPCSKALPLLCTRKGSACTDTDGGRNYFVKGSAKATTSTGYVADTDECWGLDGMTLKEVYCDDGQLRAESFVKCAYGCDDGACLSSPARCYDSDGQDIFIKGYAQLGTTGTRHYDQCGREQGYTSDKLLLEVYCDGGKIAVSENTYCPDRCEDGRCVQEVTPVYKRYCREIDGHLEEGEIPAGMSLSTYRPFKIAFLEQGDRLLLTGTNYTTVILGGSVEEEEVILQVVGPRGTETKSLKEGDSRNMAGLEVYIDEIFLSTIGRGSIAMRFYYYDNPDGLDFALYPKTECVGGDFVEYYCDGDEVEVRDEETCDFACHDELGCREFEEYCVDDYGFVERGVYTDYVDRDVPTVLPISLRMEEDEQFTIEIRGIEYDVEVIDIDDDESSVLLRVSSEGSSQTYWIDYGETVVMRGTLLVFMSDLFINNVGAYSAAAELRFGHHDAALNDEYYDEYGKPLFEFYPEEFCDGNYPVQASCSGNQLVFSQRSFPCENGCKEGHCVGDVSTCFETDGGYNIYDKGVAVGVPDWVSGGAIGNFSDYCLSARELNEMACADGKVHRYSRIICTHGCEDGACVKKTYDCTDTDGSGSLTKGHVTYSGEVMESSEFAVGDADPLDTPSTALVVYPDETALFTVNGDAVRISEGGTFTIGFVDMRILDIVYDAADYEDSFFKYEIIGVWDYCSGGNEVEEFTCGDDGRYDDDTIDCAFGCQDGACVSTSNVSICYDSDGPGAYYDEGYRIHHDLSHINAGVKEEDYCILDPEFSSIGAVIADGARMVDQCGAGEQCYAIDYHCKGDLSDSFSAKLCEFGCDDGACHHEAYCVDTDGGLNIYEAGEANMEGIGGAFDGCIGEYRIREAICLDNMSYGHEEVTCPPEAPYCFNAKCGTEKPYAEETDDGDDPAVKGTVTTFPHAEPYEHTDYCFDENDPHNFHSCNGTTCQLREFYLTTGTSYSFKDYSCVGGCADGACPQYANNSGECRDTDWSGGSSVNYYVQGTVTAPNFNGPMTDRCNTNRGMQDWLIEYHCAGDKGMVTERRCPDGCSAGVCLQEIVEPPLPPTPSNGSSGGGPGACSGCDNGEACIPYGVRMNRQYCSLSGEFMDYKDNQESCENDFECSTNLCLDDQCVSQGFFDKLWELLKKWF